MNNHELAGRLRMLAMAMDALADELLPATRPTVEEAIWFVVENYEEKCLFVKHGHKQRAGRTRQTLRKHPSARDGVIELLTNRKNSMGLTELAAIGELHNSLEQVVINYADDFPAELVVKARTNLDAFIN